MWSIWNAEWFEQFESTLDWCYIGKILRSSHHMCSVKKRVYINFRKVFRKTPVPKPIFKYFSGLRPATLLKMRLWQRWFSVNFAKFLRTPFLQNTSRLLLLIIISIHVWPKCNGHVSMVAPIKIHTIVLKPILYCN